VSTRARNPFNFPRMKYRARKRHVRRGRIFGTITARQIMAGAIVSRQIIAGPSSRHGWGSAIDINLGPALSRDAVLRRDHFLNEWRDAEPVTSVAIGRPLTWGAWADRIRAATPPTLPAMGWGDMVITDEFIARQADETIPVDLLDRVIATPARHDAARDQIETWADPTHGRIDIDIQLEVDWLVAIVSIHPWQRAVLEALRQAARNAGDE
jgi:hypothetical protein